MAVDPIDTSHLGSLFGTSDMRAVFDELATVRRYLEVEQALARAQASLDIIPHEAADAIGQVTLEDLDLATYATRTGVVGFPIAPLVAQLSELVADGYGEYAHWGATTQDIMDTALVLQIRDALSLVSRDLELLASQLTDLAAAYASTPMAGRSQLQHAMPVTFGFKVATWLAAVNRHRQRFDEAMPRLFVGQLGGAVGTLAAMHPHGLAVRDRFCEELGLAAPTITWHTTRDSLTEVVLLLANVTATLAKIGTDLALLAQTEVSEIAEPDIPGRGTSSTMPQKRNPIGSALLRTIAIAVRGEASVMLDGGVQDHERATGTWAVEWLALPRAFVLAAGALRHATTVVGGLEVDADAMRVNLDVTNGLIAAETVSMRLAPRLGRQRAHDLVAACARQAAREQTGFAAVLASNDEIAAILTAAEIEQLVDPAESLGHASDMVKAVLAPEAGAPSDRAQAGPTGVV